MRTVGALVHFRNRGATTHRALCVSIKSRPNHPNYSQLGLRVHAQTPVKRGFLALCLQQTTAEMEGCWVGRSGTSLKGTWV